MKLSMFNFTVNITLRVFRWRGWRHGWEVKIGSFWKFWLSTLVTFGFSLCHLPAFFLNQYSTRLETWFLWKELMGTFGTLIRRSAFNAEFVNWFCLFHFTMFIWLNSLSSEALDIGVHIHISIMSKAGFHWGLSSLRQKILAQKS